MSCSPIWEPSGLSSTRNASIFDLSHPRDAPCADGRVTEINKFPNLDHLDRQLPGTTFLPPIYGAIGLRRSPGLPTIIPSVTGCRFPVPLGKSSHPDYPSVTRQSFFAPLDSSYYCSPAPSGPLMNQAIRPFARPSFLSPASPPPPLHLTASYLSSVPKRSKAALAVEDWDHPSFARPPHRAFEPQLKDETDRWQPVADQLDFNHVQKTPSGMNAKPAVDDEPLVPNLYPVPPPPPYEQSAAPLSDLAADMVWERCYLTKTRGVASPASLALRPWESINPWSNSHGHHSMTGHANQIPQISDSPSNWSGAANTYGVIGAEAKARRFNRQYCTTASSPQLDHCNAANHCRRLSTVTKIEVKPAFRRWTRQVLEQTLLSPQVLILALYYIDCVASTDVFGDGNSKLSLLPYKMLLSALVVANKTLDDHSYRNSTFANVSSMTNAEVNAIEVALLSSLNFNVVPTSDQWTHWLKDVMNAGERLGFHDPHIGLHSPLSRLVISQHPNRQLQNSSPQSHGISTANQGSIFDQAPTADYGWHPHSEHLGYVTAVHHQQLSSANPSDVANLDLRMQHTAAIYHSNRDYGGSHAFSEFVPHHANYFQGSYPVYSS